jgi:hypothetical protein
VERGGDLLSKKQIELSTLCPKIHHFAVFLMKGLLEEQVLESRNE